MKFIVVIPARYASTRFPGKPLALINGKSMINRVYENSSASTLADSVFVATDDERIKKHVMDFSGNVIMTSLNHQSGTDRCAEVAQYFLNNNLYTPDDIIINVQGDEPFINHSQIDLIAKAFLDNPNINIATLAKKINNQNNLFNSNIVKVIFDKYNYAIYFSRHAIPFQRNIDKEKWLMQHDYFKHIGLYAYRIDTLLNIACLPQSSLEKAEALEQLRWIENDYKINIILTEIENISIDTPEDLKKIQATIK
jgi:3-deoxy-manno-octulosonate cytidylyltransferase (CMP-KDO synthetase)